MDERMMEIEDARKERPVAMGKVDGEWVVISEVELRQVEIDNARHLAQQKL